MLLLGRVWTFDARYQGATAVRLQGAQVTDVGAASSLRARYPGEPRQRVEWITPGLHDAHVHPLQWGLALVQLDLRDVHEPQEAARRVRAAATRQPAGTWIRGGGYAFAGYPDLELLDRAAPAHPVLLESRDLHGAWVNTPALRRAGIGPGTPDPPGGRILRDASGRPSGYLLERAVALVRRVLPPPGPQDLLRGLEDLARRGFSAVHAMGEPAEATVWVRELARKGGLPLRVAWTHLADAAHAAHPERIGEQLHVFGVKFFADGALTSRTAWMCDAYPDGATGMPLDDPRAADAVVADVLQRGLDAVWHAIGTRAVHELLNLSDRLESRGLPARTRIRIEHVQHVRDADLPRLAGRVLSVQPQHAADDRPALERLGAGRLREAYRWGSLARLPGARLLLGSDAPVAPPDPGLALELARNHPLNAEEGLALDAAVEACTHAPAAALGWDREPTPWGVVRPGARAALALWQDGRPVARVAAGEVVEVGT